MSPLRGSGINGCEFTHSLRCGLQIFRWLCQLVDREFQLARFESRAITGGAPNKSLDAGGGHVSQLPTRYRR